ncbi:MAG TPA: ATP-binding cassette domain-containing protein [Streptosporangiaceae bacterium]
MTRPPQDHGLLQARDLVKSYGRETGLVRAVDGVDLDVAAGETVAVMGPSGCGKSTLLHLLGGLDRPTRGEVLLSGRRVDRLGEKALARMRRDAIGFVFQSFHLMDEPEGPGAGLLLEGIVLRLQADLRWLEACERAWTGRKE